jgi:hypothetical protein
MLRKEIAVGFLLAGFIAQLGSGGAVPPTFLPLAGYLIVPCG